MADDEERLFCARDFTCVPDLNASIDDSTNAGFDYICVPLFHPRFKREFLVAPAKDRPGPLTRSDFLLDSKDWTALVVGKVSLWLQLDSCHDVIRRNSEQALRQELMFACHLGLSAVLVHLKNGDCVNLARVINEHLTSGPYYWIVVPMNLTEKEYSASFESLPAEEGAGEKQLEDPWKWWNKFRTLCGSSKRLGVVLELPADLPSDLVVDRWRGEPVKALIISTKIFLTNRKGFPVLSRAHQAVVKQFFEFDVQLILTGRVRNKNKGLRSYQLYLNHLFQNRGCPDDASSYSKSYDTTMTAPLQPLMDNLESQTYEAFEEDPVKYSLYQQAVYAALLDKVPESDNSQTQTLVLMVLGAGRGPLVTASLRAAALAHRNIRVYAVEKNPNAVITLENMKSESWGDQVTIVSCDMRHWNAPEKADIIVSEMLGSFGDNELSPECLDGAMKFLKDDSISIPSKYSSYLAPFQSPKLWSELRFSSDQERPMESDFEAPYVVCPLKARLLDEPKCLFTFEHPKTGVTDNNRYASLEFDVSIDSVLHGFGGYFHCTLYRDISLSIVPSSYTPELISWYPIYFPIQDPIYLRGGEKLKVHFWRAGDAKHVWYEWCVTDPVAQQIHNPRGRSSTIGL